MSRVVDGVVAMDRPPDGLTLSDSDRYQFPIQFQRI